MFCVQWHPIFSEYFSGLICYKQHAFMDFQLHKSSAFIIRSFSASKNCTLVYSAAGWNNSSYIWGFLLTSSVGITMLKAHVCFMGMCLHTFLSLCDHLQVLDVVRAAELLVNKPSSPTEMLVAKSPGGPKTDLKTTTIVMSKHTLAPQTSMVSTQHLM